MKKAYELTEEEREIFTETFYRNWPSEWGTTDAEDGVSEPWGCPWYDNANYTLASCDIVASAHAYWDECYPYMGGAKIEELHAID